MGTRAPRAKRKPGRVARGTSTYAARSRAVQEELSGIDTSSIEALKTLKDEHDVLDGRIKAMEEIKESVAAAVYVRVHADYATRLEALQAQSRPLKEQAREQYANLKRIV